MSFLGSLLGQNDFHADAQQQAFAADPAAQAEYQKRLAAWRASGSQGPAPTLQGVQQATDRSNVAGAAGQYQPLISNLQAAAVGNGPSAAQAQYQQNVNANDQRILGAAAAGNVSNGQRAALLNQAVGQVAQANQQSAMGAAQLKAQEQQAATSQLGQVLGQNVNAQNILLQDTAAKNAADQQAAMQAQQINANVAQENAKAMGSMFKGALAAGGALATGGASGLVSSGVLAKAAGG